MFAIREGKGALCGLLLVNAFFFFGLVASYCYHCRQCVFFITTVMSNYFDCYYNKYYLFPFLFQLSLCGMVY